MTFDQFLSKYSNQPVDFDGVYPNQCMDLMHQYIYDVLGITDRTVCAKPAAYQVFTQFNWPQYFEKIENTPDGIPQKGDIVFFGTAIGPYGHVCIFTEGDADKFTSFDANWPINSLCHLQNHNYNGVLGWFHPKDSVIITQPTTQSVITDQTKIPQIDNMEVQAIRSTLMDLNRENEDLKRQLAECRNKPVEAPVVPSTPPESHSITQPSLLTLIAGFIQQLWPGTKK